MDLQPAARFPAYLTDLVGGLLRRSFQDWQEMTGFEVGVRGGTVYGLNAAALRATVLDRVVLTTLIEGPFPAPVAFVFPRSFVGAAVASAMMLPSDGGPTLLDPEDETHMEAAQELMNLFCGSSTRALIEAGHDLRVSQSVEQLKVAIGALPPFNRDARVASIRFHVEPAVDDTTVSCLLGERMIGALYGSFRRGQAEAEAAA